MPRAREPELETIPAVVRPRELDKARRLHQPPPPPPRLRQPVHTHVIFLLFYHFAACSSSAQPPKRKPLNQQKTPTSAARRPAAASATRRQCTSAPHARPRPAGRLHDALGARVRSPEDSSRRVHWRFGRTSKLTWTRPVRAARPTFVLRCARLRLPPLCPTPPSPLPPFHVYSRRTPFATCRSAAAARLA